MGLRTVAAAANRKNYGALHGVWALFSAKSRAYSGDFAYQLPVFAMIMVGGIIPFDAYMPIFAPTKAGEQVPEIRGNTNPSLICKTRGRNGVAGVGAAVCHG